MRKKFVQLILDYPKRVLLAFLALTVLLLPGIFLIETDFSYRAWYSENDPLLVNFDRFESTFGNDDSIVVGIRNKDGLYNKKSLELIYDLTEKFWEIKNIIRVDSLSNYDFINATAEDIDVSPLISEESRLNIDDKFIGDLKNKVSGHKLIENFLISKDGKMAVLRAKVIPSHQQRNDNKNIIVDAQSIVADFEELYPDHSFHIAGTATFIHIFREITERDLSVMLPLLFTIFGLVLYFIYRSRTGVIFPFIVIFFSIFIMLCISGYFGHFITTISSASPSILITIAIADAVHILTVYFFALKQGFSNNDAVKYSLVKNFYPTLLTSITTAIGFLSFSNSLIKSIADLGIEVGLGVLIAWLATYLVLGPLLVLRGKIVKVEDTGENFKIEERESEFEIKNSTKTFVKFLFKFKYIILSLTIVLAISSLYQARNLEVNLNPNMQFKDDHPYKISYNLMVDHFGPMAQVEFMIDAPGDEGAKDPEFLNKVNSFDNWLNQQPYISKTVSIVDVIKEINKSINGNDKKYYTIPQTKDAVGQNLFFYTLGLPQGRDINDRISINSESIKLTAMWDILTSKEANQKIVELEQKAKEFGLTALITGKMPLFHQLTPYVVSSFIQSFAIALSAITIILIIVLRSFKLGLLALIPNVLPLILGFGIYALSGEYLDIASVLIVAVCLGIAVDDSIHFMFEYKKFRMKGYDHHKTFELIFTNTAPSLFNTTFLIAIGFGSFIIAHYIPNAKFGIMVSIILSLALVADFFVLPVVLFISDKISRANS